MNVRKLPVFNEFVGLNSIYNKQRSFKHINMLYYGVRHYCDCLKEHTSLVPTETAMSYEPKLLTKKVLL